MKNQGWISWAGLLFLLHAVARSASVLAAPLPVAPEPGMRLIETAPGVRAWMTPAEVRKLAARSHRDGHCGGFMDVTGQPIQPSRRHALGFYDVVGYPNPQHRDQVQALLSQLSTQQMTDTVKHLSTAYPNRFYQSQTGVEAAHWIQAKFLELAHGRKDVTAELFVHGDFIQPSVIVRIAGAGPHAQEHVVLGAHEDSVNWEQDDPKPDDIAPGADDDASGIATLIETFRVLTASDFHPDRTIDFIAYAGEELGLLGSQEIAAQYADDDIEVVGAQQFDMTFYPGSKTPKVAIISDHTSKALNRFTEKLLDAYVHVPWRTEKCKYACSDHASWDKAGFAASFPFEAAMGNDDPKIHTAEDKLDILSPDYGLHFAKLAVAFAVELADP
jgi:leucyl aminopeptidase